MRGVCRYGFSLIELLVIVFILGLLAAILLPVFAQACGYYEASLAIYRELGHKGGPAGNLNNLALVHRELREWETARALEAESERLWMEYGSVEGKVGVLLTQGERARHEAGPEVAWARYEECLALARSAGLVSYVGHALMPMISMALEQRDLVRARALLAERWVLWSETESDLGQPPLLERFAALAVAERQMEAAARLLGAAATVREAYGYRLDGDERHERDHLVAAIRQEYDKPLFNAAWEEGRAMRAEQAMEYALEATGVTVQRVSSQSKDGMAPQEAL
jgi:hypothetical protein